MEKTDSAGWIPQLRRWAVPGGKDADGGESGLRL